MSIHPTPSTPSTEIDDRPGPSIHQPPRHRRRIPTFRAILLALSLMVTAFAITSIEGGGKAEAWAWSSHVKVAGRISCANQGVVGSPRVTIQLANGEVASGTANWLNNYGVQFLRIPAGGVAGTATVTCPTWAGQRSFQRQVWVFRPTVGSQISVNFSG